ncbi:uncharacterized protein LOC130673212 [Microplitis mediator]|uniref:uncharacterized protein LOC130673212 n=1 Tax=Microplitis mediator TaxID=375433 RepID=UPI0025541245|nr:uncharacterized protein LOC130673212 [Microplitis mediator]
MVVFYGSIELIILMRISNSLLLLLNGTSKELGEPWEDYDDPILGIPIKFSSIETNISSVMKSDKKLPSEPDYNPILGEPFIKSTTESMINQLYLLTQDNNLKESFFLNWDYNRAILDIAYYLRSHKFNDFDRRYYNNINDYEDTGNRLYKEFTKPPLRSLHWEVYKYCNGGFFQCLKYIDSIVEKTSPRRIDDTTYVIIQNNWNTVTHSEQINITDNECKSARDKNYSPFHGPLERFQWRTSISYYMCWYTIINRPELKYFNESCDNFSNCLDEKYGTNNKDPRANDDIPFSCAFYSFCPDPCCPLRHVLSIQDCVESKFNPCSINSQGESGNCYFPFDKNYNLNSLIKNELNITCDCQDSGYEWSSKFGLCVDIDECSKKLDNCSHTSNTVCINLPGSFYCACQLGYIYNIETESCQVNWGFKKILMQSSLIISTTTESLFDIIVNTLTKKIDIW